MSKKLIAALFTILATASVGHAQEPTTAAGGDVRAPSPRIMDPNRPGYFALGVGPSFAFGLNAETMLYNVAAAYNRNFSDRLTGKLFGDFNFGASSDPSRLINVGMGLDIFLQEVRPSYGIPYLMADVGFGFARDHANETKDAVMVGTGAGFKFASEALNFDVNLHYAVMTSDIRGRTPSVLGTRLAVNF